MKVNEEKRANAKIMPYSQRSVNFEISFLFLQFSQKTKKKIQLYYHTLLFYQIEPQKNGHSLILPSSNARKSSAPKAKRIFEIL